MVEKNIVVLKSIAPVTSAPNFLKKKKNEKNTTDLQETGVGVFLSSIIQ